MITNKVHVLYVDNKDDIKALINYQIKSLKTFAVKEKRTKNINVKVSS